jgi:hypothetical protein
MVRFGDPALECFDNRDNPGALEKYMRAYRDRAAKAKQGLREYEKRKGYRF